MLKIADVIDKICEDCDRAVLFNAERLHNHAIRGEWRSIRPCTYYIDHYTRILLHYRHGAGPEPLLRVGLTEEDWCEVPLTEAQEYGVPVSWDMLENCFWDE